MATQVGPMEGYSNFRGWCEEQKGRPEYWCRIEIVLKIMEDHYAEEIDFSGKEITSWPSDLGRMDSLKTIDASANQLAEIDATIGNLRKLQNLDLSQNKLAKLPLWAMARLTALRTLNLANNRFGVGFLQELVAILPRSCKVDVRGNNLSEEDQRALKSTVEHIRKADPKKGPEFRFSTFQD